MSESLDVAVVGAGQAGLAIGYHLAQHGRRFAIFEAAPTVGAAWSARWESLVLFTPRRHDSLPGLPFPGDPDGYPDRDEVVAYLKRYAEEFELPVETNSRVSSLASVNDEFRLEIEGGGSVAADQVVVATGPFQSPRIPPLAADLGPEVKQMHSVEYRKPDDLPRGTVLVVGGGNTGFQIAQELAPSRDVHLSVGSRQTPLPQRILGRDLFWYLERLGVMRKNVNSRLGNRLRDRETLIGSSPRGARRSGVGLRGRAVGASGDTVGFDDGTDLRVDGVVWATGFRTDYTWIQPPVLDEAGSVVHVRGLSRCPGLYFLGMQWQYTRGSALLGWVEEDAAHIAEQIATRINETGSPPGEAGPAQTAPIAPTRN